MIMRKCVMMLSSALVAMALVGCGAGDSAPAVTEEAAETATEAVEEAAETATEAVEEAAEAVEEAAEAPKSE
jgi:hypothetical protein